MFVAPLRHWYVKPDPVAATENVTDPPTHWVALDGLFVIAGGAHRT
jgi:hypothetical protein